MVDHPFLLGIEYCFQTEYNIYFVMKYIQGGSLFNHLEIGGVFSEERTKRYIFQMALALDYLHSKKVIYRDLKTENVLLNEDGYLYIIDYGMAKFLEGADEVTNTYCGTHEYLAPEIV